MGDKAGIANWFEVWGHCVAGCDFARARAMFSEDVIGFGTYMDMVRGIEALEASQWRNIWPTIRDFAFDLDSLEVQFSPDARLAVAMVLWNSTGISEDGSPYSRPGRATVALRRDEGTWRGLHTHFSLFPAEQKLSFGSD